MRLGGEVMVGDVLGADRTNGVRIYRLPHRSRMGARTTGMLLALLAPMLLVIAILCLRLIWGRWLKQPGLQMEEVFSWTCTSLFVVLAGTFGCLGLSIYLNADHVVLILDEDGIEYHHVGYRIVTDWKNIRRIGCAYYGRHGIEGLVLCESAMEGINL